MENGLYLIYSKSFFLLDYFLVTLRRGGGAQFPHPSFGDGKEKNIFCCLLEPIKLITYKGNLSLRLNFFKHMLTSL